MYFSNREKSLIPQFEYYGISRWEILKPHRSNIIATVKLSWLHARRYHLDIWNKYIYLHHYYLNGIFVIWVCMNRCSPSLSRKSYRQKADMLSPFKIWPDITIEDFFQRQFLRSLKSTIHNQLRQHRLALVEHIPVKDFLRQLPLLQPFLSNQQTDWRQSFFIAFWKLTASPTLYNFKNISSKSDQTFFQFVFPKSSPKREWGSTFIKCVWLHSTAKNRSWQNGSPSD